MGTCAVASCGKKSRAKGLCMAHYMRLRIYGHADEPRRRAVDGSGSAHIAGYRVVPTLAGPRLEHIAVAEKALGRPLPRGAKVHHVNHDRADNRPENLVICPNEKYHRLLHTRERALIACGNADWRKCAKCGRYDSQQNLRTIPSAPCAFYHPGRCRSYLT
jgi:hypothetical protein